MFYKLLVNVSTRTTLLLVTVSLSLLSCADSVGPEPVRQVSCSTHKNAFDSEVWPVLRSKCFSCHRLNGVDSNLVLLQPENFNNFAQANFNTFQKIAAKTDINGISLLSVKPINANNDHSGGAVLEIGTPDYQAINNMVANLSTCKADTLVTADLDLGSNYQQLRKTTLALAGRLPSPEEEQQILASSDDIAQKETAMDKILDGLLTDDYYFERVKIMFNDLYLLDAFPGVRALGQFDLRNFTDEDYFDSNATTSPIASYTNREKNTLRLNANQGLAQAPLELIAHVVKEGRPFTEILTAKYTMVNPYSATLYGVKDADIQLNNGETSFKFQAPDPVDKRDASDFREAILTDKNSREIPHAGILTTPTFLRRYPSTNTNRNRARSRVVYSYFLDINVLGLASREGLDLDNVSGNPPTLEAAQCKKCHDTIDPIAGLFKNWSNAGFYRGNFTGWPYKGNSPKILAPGFIDVSDPLPDDNSGAALQWLAGKIVKDAGFTNRVVKIVFKGFTGQGLPVDFNFVEALKTNFVTNNYNLKSLTKEIINSPYFLARNLNNNAKPSQFPDVGMGRLLTPELLDRKIQAVTGGYRWKSPAGKTLSDLATYKLLYGGIDSTTITTRTTDPTSLIAGAQQQIANQTACVVVPGDFNKDTDKRSLFPTALITDVPDDAEATQRIKENIIHLYKLLLGEQITIDATDVTRAYNLFVAVRDLTEGVGLPACRYRPTITKLVSEDIQRTVRPWTAVVSYLLSDYHFYYE